MVVTLSDRLHRAAAAAAQGADIGPILTTGAIAVTDATRTVDPLAGAAATAACCDVSTSAGLPLADVLDAVAQSARSHAVLVGRAKAELAGASTTSVVLGCLPVGRACHGPAARRPTRSRPPRHLVGAALLWASRRC